MGSKIKQLRAPLALLAAFVMIGCASVYKKDTSCPGFVETGKCYDLREAYDASHDFDRNEYRQRLKAQRDDKDISPDRSPHNTYAVYRPSQPMMVSDEQPRPILTQAVPVRVFIDPYEDAAGRLHTPGYIYVRATEPKWIFGDDKTRRSRVATPLVRDN